MPVTHAKTNTVADWTQAQLDAAIAEGKFAAGTVLADIVLPSDWNDDHTVAIGISDLTATGTPSATTFLRGDNTWAVPAGGGGGSVESVTGLNTDNTDPTNPVVQISVDGVTITGAGTPASPLVSTGGAPGFDDITSGTNTTAAMVVGTGGSLGVSGSGTIAATTSLAVTGTSAITSTSASALAVGANGATNPVLKVNANTASVATGVEIIGAATAGGVQLNAIDSGGNGTLNINAQGSGGLNLRAGTGANALTLGTNATSRFSMTNAQYTFSGLAASSSTLARFSYVSTADTSLTANTEALLVNWNLSAIRQHATGTVTLQRDYRIMQSTHSAVGASTITDAAMLAVDGAPAQGSNMSITNSSAIYSGGGAVGAGVTNSYGLNVKANTGATNNYAARFDGAIDLNGAGAGTSGQVLTSGGAGAACTWTTASGSGDVSKVGTPANNQMAVWTGDGTLEGTSDFTYDGTNLNLITGKNLQIAGATVLADAAGTTTLSNIDALDATTEATIEAAIDTLANLTSIQGLTVTLSDAGTNAVFGWDDTAGAYENLTKSEARNAIGVQNIEYSFTFGDGTNAIVAGAGYDVWVRVKEAFTITGVELTADASSSAVLDIWVDTYANFPPTVADTITASAKPTLSSAVKYQDTTLTGWTTSVAKGSYIKVHIDSSSTAKRLYLVIYGTNNE